MFHPGFFVLTLDVVLESYYRVVLLYAQDVLHRNPSCTPVHTSNNRRRVVIRILRSIVSRLPVVATFMSVRLRPRCLTCLVSS